MEYGLIICLIPAVPLQLYIYTITIDFAQCIECPRLKIPFSSGCVCISYQCCSPMWMGRISPTSLFSCLRSPRCLCSVLSMALGAPRETGHRQWPCFWLSRCCCRPWDAPWAAFTSSVCLGGRAGKGWLEAPSSKGQASQISQTWALPVSAVSAEGAPCGNNLNKWLGKIWKMGSKVQPYPASRVCYCS